MKEQPSGELRGMVEIGLAMVLAGSSVVVGRVLAVRLPVFLSTELSLCSALLTALPLQLGRRRELAALNGRQLGLMFLQALFGLVLFRVLTLNGLRLTSAAHAGLITSAAPALMALLAALVLGERPGPRGWLGVGLASAGLLAANLHALASRPPAGFLAGSLLVLAATACEALLTIFRRRAGARVGPVTNTTVLVGMGALLTLPFALLELRSFPLSRVGTVGWLACLYYGAFATVVAYILWGDGATRIPAGRSGVAMAALPLSVLALSALVLGEEVRPGHVLGAAAVIAGMVAGREGRRRGCGSGRG